MSYVLMPALPVNGKARRESRARRLVEKLELLLRCWPAPAMLAWSLARRRLRRTQGEPHPWGPPPLPLTPQSAEAAR
jgi:hypothetical protein